MPDNTPQDWSTDREFWDQAWSDMDRRLNQRKRKPFLLLWWLLPLALGIAYLTLDTDEANDPTRIQASADRIAPTEEIAAEVPTPEVADTDRRDAAPGPAMNTLTSTGSTAARVGSHAVTARIAETATVGVGSPAYPSSPDASVIVAPASPPPVPLATLPYAVPVPLAYTFMPDLRPAEVMAKHIIPATDPVRWRTAGGLSYYPTADSPGYFLAQQYRTEVGRGWFVPLTLRLDRTYRQISVSSTNDAVADLAANAPSTIYVNAAANFDLRLEDGQGIGLTATTVSFRPSGSEGTWGNQASGR